MEMPTTSLLSSEKHSYALSIPSGNALGRQAFLNSSYAPGLMRRVVIQTTSCSGSTADRSEPLAGVRRTSRELRSTGKGERA